MALRTGVDSSLCLTLQQMMPNVTKAAPGILAMASVALSKGIGPRSSDAKIDGAANKKVPARVSMIAIVVNTLFILIVLKIVQRMVYHLLPCAGIVTVRRALPSLFTARLVGFVSWSERITLSFKPV
jgi:hypothetical protein